MYAKASDKDIANRFLSNQLDIMTKEVLKINLPDKTKNLGKRVVLKPDIGDYIIRRPGDMTNQQLLDVREELLREFMRTTRLYKAEIFVKILDIDEEIEDTRRLI